MSWQPGKKGIVRVVERIGLEEPRRSADPLVREHAAVDCDQRRILDHRPVPLGKARPGVGLDHLHDFVIADRAFGMILARHECQIVGDALDEVDRHHAGFERRPILPASTKEAVVEAIDFRREAGGGEQRARCILSRPIWPNPANLSRVPSRRYFRRSWPGTTAGNRVPSFQNNSRQRPAERSRGAPKRGRITSSKALVKRRWRGQTARASGEPKSSPAVSRPGKRTMRVSGTPVPQALAQPRRTRSRSSPGPRLRRENGRPAASAGAPQGRERA